MVVIIGIIIKHPKNVFWCFVPCIADTLFMFFMFFGVILVILISIITKKNYFCIRGISSDWHMIHYLHVSVAAFFFCLRFIVSVACSLRSLQIFFLKSSPLKKSCMPLYLSNKQSVNSEYRTPYGSLLLMWTNVLYCYQIFVFFQSFTFHMPQVF